MIFQSVKFKIIESLKISYINKIHYQEIIINIPDWIPFKQRNFSFLFSIFLFQRRINQRRFESNNVHQDDYFSILLLFHFRKI